MILCGDMNSTPNSAIYQFITKGHIDCKNLDRQLASGQATCCNLVGDYKHGKFSDVDQYTNEIFLKNTKVFDISNCLGVNIMFYSL